MDEVKVKPLLPGGNTILLAGAHAVRFGGRLFEQIVIRNRQTLQ